MTIFDPGVGQRAPRSLEEFNAVHEPPKNLSLDDLRRIAGVNLRAGGNGAMTAEMRRTQEPRERQWLQWLKGVGDTEMAALRDKGPVTVPVANPVVLPPMMPHAPALTNFDGTPADIPRLSAVNLEEIRRLPADPAEFTDEHIRLVNGWARQMRHPDDLRLLRSIVEPVHALHAERFRREQLQRVVDSVAPMPVASMPKARDWFVECASERIREALPELTESEARARAAEEWTEIAKGASAVIDEHTERVTAARTKLGAPALPQDDSWNSQVARFMAGRREREAERQRALSDAGGAV